MKKTKIILLPLLLISTFSMLLAQGLPENGTPTKKDRCAGLSKGLNQPIQDGTAGMVSRVEINQDSGGSKVVFEYNSSMSQMQVNKKFLATNSSFHSGDELECCGKVKFRQGKAVCGAPKGKAKEYGGLNKGQRGDTVQ